MEDENRFIGYHWEEAEPMFAGRRVTVKHTRPPRLDPASVAHWRVVRVREQGDTTEVLLVPDTDGLLNPAPESADVPAG